MQARAAGHAFACCEDVRVMLPAETPSTWLVSTSGESGHGNGSLTLAPGERITYAAYASSWGGGSFARETLVADKPALHVRVLPAVAGGIHTFNLFDDARMDGTYVASNGVGVGHAGTARADFDSAHGYFLSVFASTYQHGTVALRWSLADGAKSATQPAANAVLQAGGSASGPVSIAA
ncbi:MAG: hypothetical protein ACYDCK_09655, partial [Thermoplasmatota archaeon]